MMVVIPSYSEMGPVDQLLVPNATPEPPVELVQVICVRPELSCAVPLTTIELAVVETKVEAGDKIVSVGGAALLPGLGLDGALGFAVPEFDVPGFDVPEFDVPVPGAPEIGVSESSGWLVTVALAEAVSSIASCAVTVITFVPALSGIELMDHDDPETAADPDAPWFVDQLTEIAPDPPDTVPFSAMDDALVVASGGCMTIASGGRVAEFVETTGA